MRGMRYFITGLLGMGIVLCGAWADEEPAAPAAATDAGKPSAPEAEKATAPPNPLVEPMPDVLVRIGDQTITSEAFLKEERAALGVGKLKPGDVASDSQLAPLARRDLLKSMVNNTLLSLYSAKLGYSVAQDVLDRNWDELKNGFPSLDTFNQDLERRGMTEEEARKRFDDAFRVSKFLELKSSAIKVDESEVHAKYQEMLGMGGLDLPDSVIANQLIVPFKSATGEDNSAKAEELITAAYERVQKGETFEAAIADLLKSYPGARSQDKVRIIRGTAGEETDKAVFDTKEGAVSKPFKGQMGWTMVLVEKLHPARSLTFEEAKPWIEDQAMNPKRDQFMADLLESAAKEFPVEYFWPKRLVEEQATKAAPPEAETPKTEATE